MLAFKEWLLEESKNQTMSAKKIKDMVKLYDHKYKMYKSAQGDDDKLLKLKYQEAKKDGLLADILENGIKYPLEIHVDENNNKTLIKGHHRLAIALKHFPNRKIKIKYINKS